MGEKGKMKISKTVHRKSPRSAPKIDANFGRLIFYDVYKIDVGLIVIDIIFLKTSVNVLVAYVNKRPQFSILPQMANFETIRGERRF